MFTCLAEPEVWNSIVSKCSITLNSSNEIFVAEKRKKEMKSPCTKCQETGVPKVQFSTGTMTMTGLGEGPYTNLNLCLKQGF